MWVMQDQKYLGQHTGWSRATQFADGLFETMVVKEGMIQGLTHHVARLSSGCHRLNIALSSDHISALFIKYTEQLIAQSGMQSGLLKILVSRGDSERGYAYDDNIKPTSLAFYNPLPQYPDNIYTQGVSLKSLNTQCSIQPQMAGIKHLNRLENVLAKKELANQAFEGLMFNHLGWVIEGTSSNVFFEKNNRLLTPKLNLSGVAGVMRQCVLSYSEHNRIDTEINDITSQQLAQFEHAFICNSVMGIVPIASIDGRTLKIGVLTKTLQTAWNEGVIYA